jgi:hypothetical protein
VRGHEAYGQRSRPRTVRQTRTLRRRARTRSRARMGKDVRRARMGRAVASLSPIRPLKDRSLAVISFVPRTISLVACAGRPIRRPHLPRTPRRCRTRRPDAMRVRSTPRGARRPQDGSKRERESAAAMTDIVACWRMATHRQPSEPAVPIPPC